MAKTESEGASASEFLTPPEVESIWPFLTRSFLERARAKGDGPPFIKLSNARNGRVMYRRDAVEKWLMERETVR